MLIVCGSATSWIIKNLLTNKKGFHNRVTRRVHLAPFSLAECEKLFELNDVVMTRKQMIESYDTTKRPFVSVIFYGIISLTGLLYFCYDIINATIVYYDYISCKFRSIIVPSMRGKLHPQCSSSVKYVPLICTEKMEELRHLM